MLSSSYTLKTITSSFGLQGTCLFLIFISTLFLAVPLLSHRNKIFEKFRLHFGQVLAESPKKSVPLASSIPLESGSTDDVTMILHAEEIRLPLSAPAEVVAPESSSALEPPSPRSVSMDDNLVTYSSYRHKLIEETLQKRYGGGYAPGNVILNLIELNTVDSSSKAVLEKKYDVSFFDLVNVELERSGLEYPDQLAHFIPTNPRKRSTNEIHTEISEDNVTPSTRPNTPTSCQRVTTKRSRDVAKSPFLTPVQSQAPINVTESVARDVKLLGAPPTEQLYRRKDAGPDVLSKTHVEAEAEYLYSIAKSRRNEKKVNQGMRMKSSLKKSGQRENKEAASYDRNGRRVGNEKTGDCNGLRRSPVRDDLRNFSSAKPTVVDN